MRQTNLFVLLLVALLSACHRAAPDAAEQQLADSVLKAEAGAFYTNPARADSSLAALEKTLTDSAVRMQLTAFRGTAHRLMGDSLGSDSLYETVRAFCHRQPGHDYLMGIIHNHQGVGAILSGKIDEAAHFYSLAFDELSRPPKRKELIATAINLADIEMQRGQLPLSAEHYRYALFLCDSLGEGASRHSIRTGLGQVYMELRNFPLAHSFFQEAGRDLKEQDIYARYFYHSSYGNCYYFEERYDEALEEFQRAMKEAEAMNNALGMLYCSANMAEIYLMEDHTAEATVALEKADSLRRVIERLPGGREAIGQASASNIHSLKADLEFARHGYDPNSPKLRVNYDSLLKDSPRYLMLHYRRLERYAARAGRYKQAYDYQGRSMRYADSLRNSSAMNSVEEMGQRYRRDTTLLRQEIALSDYATQTARQQSYIVGSTLTALVIALAVVIAIVMYRRRTERRLQQQVERMNELRMDIVRNRVSPHYIFNVLGTVLPRLQQYPDLAAPLELLIDVLRGNLLTSGHVAVALRDEVTLVERYVRLHHYSHGARPRVEWEVDEALRESPLLVPSMSLQIPLENALKHAFPTLTDESEIRIRVEVSADEVIHLMVTDNGRGYNPGQVKPTGRDTGTGLRLLTRTIEILNRYNHRPARFSIVNRPRPEHGTVMHLEIPTDYGFEVGIGNK